jgi:hypothetical protein
VDSTTKPKLEAKISRTLAAMTVPESHSFFSGFAKKEFYIHGITQGLSVGGAVSADANKHRVKVLQRVKSHILRPLWWSMNSTRWTHGFVKGCHNLAQKIIAGWYGLLNGFKSAFNRMFDREYFILSKKNPDSSDFNNTAFDFANTVNKLNPLDAGHVKKKDCPEDVVIHMEDFVDKRPAKPEFFESNSGKPTNKPENSVTLTLKCK